VSCISFFFFQSTSVSTRPYPHVRIHTSVSSSSLYSFVYIQSLVASNGAFDVSRDHGISHQRAKDLSRLWQFCWQQDSETHRHPPHPHSLRSRRFNLSTQSSHLPTRISSLYIRSTAVSSSVLSPTTDGLRPVRSHTTPQRLDATLVGHESRRQQETPYMLRS